MRTRTSDCGPEFDRFWSEYPRRVAKLDAQKAWRQLAPDTETINRIFSALEWQKKQPNWLAEGGVWVPYPASWIRGRRWDDEPMTVTALAQPQPVSKSAKMLSVIQQASHATLRRNRG